MVFCVFMFYQCFRSPELHWMWYIMGGGGAVLFSAKFIAQILEYRAVKRRIDELDNPNTA